jgi:hypothetical protein
VFSYSGPDWLQNIILNLTPSVSSQVLLLIWRSWHLRNDIIHDKGDETIARSVACLLSHENFLQTDAGVINDAPRPLANETCYGQSSNAIPPSVSNWSRPKMNALKMNVNAAFNGASYVATAGIVAGRGQRSSRRAPSWRRVHVLKKQKPVQSYLDWSLIVRWP